MGEKHYHAGIRTAGTLPCQCDELESQSQDLAGESGKVGKTANLDAAVANYESDILAAMVNAFRVHAGLSNQQLRIKVRDDLYRNAPADSVDRLDKMTAFAFDRLGAKAFDLRVDLSLA